MTQRRFAVFSWSLLLLLVGVILWGAYVRATGSGAGCGSHWPLCNGEVVPRSDSSETLIEFSHRVTSGLALLAGIGLVLWAFRLFPARHLVRRAAAITLLLLIAEAVIGAGIVLFELVEDDDSTARAGLMAFHLANTFLLLAASTTASVTAGGVGPPQRRLWRSPQLGIVLCLGAMLVVGASGAVAALGDTLFPASTLVEAIDRDFSSNSHFLVRLRIFHPFLAVGAAALVLLTAWQVTDQSARARLHSLPTVIVTLVLAQTLAGAINVFLLAPIWLQMLHLLLADLLWISLVALLLVLAARPVRSGPHSA